MFKIRKDSELHTLYGNQKAVTEMPISEDQSSDPMYKFKRNVSLKPSYELYMAGERKLTMEKS